MNNKLSLIYFLKLFPTDDACLDEIKRLRFPKGIYCNTCQEITSHYKLSGRMSYSCQYCRHHVYPLKNTIFEKTSTPLRIWFYCIFLMTHARGSISALTLQKELGVTYKAAWRMRHLLYRLMEKNNGDLLKESQDLFALNFFNAFEVKVVEKKEAI